MLFPTLSSANFKPESRGREILPTRMVGVPALLCGLSALVVGGFAGANTVLALTAPVLQTLNNASNLAWGSGAQTSIGGIVGYIILTILGLLGIIFVILLTYGGFLWVTSAGEDEKVKKATGLIFNAVIGALIVIAAYAITYYVLQKIGTAVS